MNALEYASELIRFDTVSSKSNADISDYIDGVLGGLGFETEQVDYVIDGVRKVNVIGRKGSGSGGVAYFGHTDVVPVENWSITGHGPFEPTVSGDRLYGRGATDMKGSVACMIAAIDALSKRNNASPIYICCSADEELDHRGIKEVASRSAIYRELCDAKACGIVGEPTNMDVVYAHKGGVQIVVTSNGKAAHSSTCEGVNANLAMIPFLQTAKALYEETQSDQRWWDAEFDPPTVNLNIGINDHNPAVNITSPKSVCTLCFRSMPSTDVKGLIGRIQQAAEDCGLEFLVTAQNPPFRRGPNDEFATHCAAICQTNSSHPRDPRTVAFGTEAGNLDHVEQLIVLGPGDIAQAHKSDEWISLEQLELGFQAYRRILEQRCYE